MVKSCTHKKLAVLCMQRDILDFGKLWSLVFIDFYLSKASWDKILYKEENSCIVYEQAYTGVFENFTY